MKLPLGCDRLGAIAIDAARAVRGLESVREAEVAVPPVPGYTLNQLQARPIPRSRMRIAFDATLSVIGCDRISSSRSRIQGAAREMENVGRELATVRKHLEEFRPDKDKSAYIMPIWVSDTLDAVGVALEHFTAATDPSVLAHAREVDLYRLRRGAKFLNYVVENFVKLGGKEGVDRLIASLDNNSDAEIVATAAIDFANTREALADRQRLFQIVAPLR